MLILDSTDVAELVDFDDVIRFVEDAYRQLGRGQFHDIPRENVPAPANDGELKTLMAAGPAGFGVYCYTAGWSERTSDLFWNATIVFGADRGEMLCIIENNQLSWMRTGATSAVATDHCAVDCASTLGMIGAGRQARSQLLAIAAVRDLEAVSIYSPTEANRVKYANEMSEATGIPITTVDSAKQAVKGFDIVCTATTSDTPVIQGEWIDLGTHVNAIGSHYPGDREIDTRTVTRSRVVVDSLARAQKEEGELLIPASEGAFEWDSAVELGDIVAGKAPGRQRPDDITFMTSGALATEVLVVARNVYELAVAKGRGVSVEVSS